MIEFGINQFKILFVDSKKCKIAKLNLNSIKVGVVMLGSEKTWKFELKKLFLEDFNQIYGPNYSQIAFSESHLSNFLIITLSSTSSEKVRRRKKRRKTKEER